MNKQSEEMAKILYQADENSYKHCGNTKSCKECKYHIGEFPCTQNCRAEALYNAGYRKVNEIEKMKFYREAYEQGKFDANAEIAVGEKVVVSRAEYEALQRDLINTEMNLQHITKEYEQTRKETAREILQEVSTIIKAIGEDYDLSGNQTLSMLCANIHSKVMDKLAEKYGVEVE